MSKKGGSQRPYFEERKCCLPLVIATFPEAKLEEQKALERQKEAQAQDFAAKFSGNLVMRLLSKLKGKALGEFIVSSKASVPHFQNFVLEPEPYALKRYILKFFRHRMNEQNLRP